MTDADQATSLPSLRLLLVLEGVARAGVPVTPTEVNEGLGLPKPTIHRLFATLEEAGFLQRDIDGRSYTPGRRMREIAGGILSSLRVRTARIAILTRLAGEIGETCNIALPDRTAMTYLERVETEWPLRIQLPIGTQVPFHCTASGKMYLSTLTERHLERYLAAADLEAHTPATITEPQRLRAELRDIRKRGHATDAEEFIGGMVALAVPVLETNGRLMSTLSFHAPTQRFDLDRALAFVPQMRAASAELSRLIVAD
ncbi:IclR family transcriptional regulator [Jannaschia rubra]|uniref:Acetate operon repressor n=1 Tax=Jannaschia rubra TaxID=282197 RepID=A0A0M6XTY6_9RHOB|nr:IclR family transcriptional regulator [Jannaschia rubra]CTQ34639.1 Acetate operon repressor [Jannaschia rubra]SFG64886.1 transcriptional regulator, IclR family [Jannaschia rubra]